MAFHLDWSRAGRFSSLTVPRIIWEPLSVRRNAIRQLRIRTPCFICPGCGADVSREILQTHLFKYVANTFDTHVPNGYFSLVFFSETFYRGSGQSTSCIDHVWKFHFWHQKGNACLSPIKPLITALAKLITSSTSALWNWFWMALRRSARKVSVCPFVSFPLIKRLWYYRTHGLSRPINFYFGRQIERITRRRSIHLCTWPLFNIKSAEKQPARLVCASRIGTGCMQQPHYGADNKHTESSF